MEINIIIFYAVFLPKSIYFGGYLHPFGLGVRTPTQDGGRGRGLANRVFGRQTPLQQESASAAAAQTINAGGFLGCGTGVLFAHIWLFPVSAGRECGQHPVGELDGVPDFRETSGQDDRGTVEVPGVKERINRPIRANQRLP
jgi:hypothetical protein